MGKHDYHMHPQILTRPGWAEEFIQQAIRMEIEEICFTDHMPFTLSNAKDRIPRGGVSEYCEKTEELAEKYRDVIKIKTGIEIDYHPDYQNEIETVLRSGKFDYVIGSSHLQLEGYGFDLKAMTGDDFVTMTLKNILASVKSGYFDAVAHMDFYRWVLDNPKKFPLRTQTFDYEMHREIIAEILEEIKCRKMILEINTHRMATIGGLENTYPCRETLEMSLTAGVRYRFGSDAHVPEDVGFGWKELKQDSFYGQFLI